MWCYEIISLHFFYVVFWNKSYIYTGWQIFGSFQPGMEKILTKTDKNRSVILPKITLQVASVTCA